ncbi:hypothetical protein Tco_1292540 [Tanacetum coccineum]
MSLWKSLQALSNLHYLFGGFMDYLWSRELVISNFGLADRKILPVVRNVPPSLFPNSITTARSCLRVFGWFLSLYPSVWG